MGLSNFPSAAEGLLPVLVMNTVLSVALLKNMIRSLLQVVGASSGSSNSFSSLDEYDEDPDNNTDNIARKRRVSTTQFKSLCQNRSSICEVSSSSSSSTAAEDGAADIACSCSGSGNGSGWANSAECCVCLCGFEADDKVSELSCKHFFHKGCLDKWFHNKHTTCPLCRSIH